MNKLALVISLIVTLILLIVIDFLTLFIVIASFGYYRYLVVQNSANKLSEFNHTILIYIELIGKYVIKAADSLINIFF